MPGWDYAEEKLYGAVLILSTGTGTLQERLQSAWRDSLERLFSPRHFPLPEISIKYNQLIEDIELLDPSGIGLLRLSDHDAHEFAARTLRLFWRVANLKGL